MKRFFETEQLVVSVVAAQRQDEESAPAEESGGGVSMAILAAGVLAGLAIVGAAAYFLMR